MPSTPPIYLSYAWPEPSTPAAAASIVEQFCQVASERGVDLRRDKTEMQPGHSISGFMEEIARGGRIVVVITEKYLRSPFCMAELYGIWQQSKSEVDVFRKRTRFYLGEGGQSILEMQGRMDAIRHWQERNNELDQIVKTNGIAMLGEIDRKTIDLASSLSVHLKDILSAIADTLHPANLDALLEYSFAEQIDEPPVASSSALGLQEEELHPVPPRAMEETIRLRLDAIFANEQQQQCYPYLVDSLPQELVRATARAHLGLMRVSAVGSLNTWNKTVRRWLDATAASARQQVWSLAKAVHLLLLTRLVSEDWLEYWRTTAGNGDKRLIRVALNRESPNLGVEVLAARMVEDRWVQFSEESDQLAEPHPGSAIDTAEVAYRLSKQPTANAAIEELGHDLRGRFKLPPRDALEHKDWLELDANIRTRSGLGKHSYYLVIEEGKDGSQYAHPDTLALMRQYLPNLPRFLLGENSEQFPDGPFVCSPFEVSAVIRGFWDMNPKAK